jgi:hypothetical protein
MRCPTRRCTVTGSVCVLWQARRSAAWYKLSEAEAAELLAKDSKSIMDLGGRNLITCDSRGDSDPWEWFGIDELPSYDAHLAHIDALEGYQLFIYWECAFTVATRVQADA